MGIVSSVMGMVRRRPGRSAVAGVIAAGVFGFALYWFAPWNLFVDRRVDEAIPIAEGAGGDDATAGATGANDDGDVAAGTEDDAAEDETGNEAGDEDAAEEEAGPSTLARGRFADLEHATSGGALILELEDGSRYLRLQGLSTSNGPDLRVLISDQPLSDDWHVWADGDHLDLGPLKGNLGSSNYEIPDGVDLSTFRTAVIWCRRFTVGFGVAPLDGLSS